MSHLSVAAVVTKLDSDLTFPIRLEPENDATTADHQQAQRT